jgi:hypothetical protein
MANRKVYEPGRDRGWSNGRYWKEKQRDRGRKGCCHAFCPDCETETLHEWDICTVCDIPAEQARGIPKLVQHEAVSAFVQNIAD